MPPFLFYRDVRVNFGSRTEKSTFSLAELEVWAK
jgi:hypothetical protein